MNRPLIIVVAEKISSVRPALEEFHKAHPLWKVFKNPDAEQRLQMQEITTGLCILTDRKYMRGIDTKFKTNADVIVLGSHAFRSYTELVQIAGRGCRRSGPVKCSIFVMLSKDITVEGVEKQIKVNENQHFSIMQKWVQSIKNAELYGNAQEVTSNLFHTLHKAITTKQPYLQKNGCIVGTLGRKAQEKLERVKEKAATRKDLQAKYLCAFPSQKVILRLLTVCLGTVHPYLWGGGKRETQKGQSRGARLQNPVPKTHF
jgi:hypothetical protein